MPSSLVSSLYSWHSNSLIPWCVGSLPHHTPIFVSSHIMKGGHDLNSRMNIAPKFLNVFIPNKGKCGQEKTPHLDIIHAVTGEKSIFWHLL